MGKQKKNFEEKFITDNKIRENYNKALIIDPKLWYNLESVKHHYKNRSKYCKSIAKDLVMEILEDKKLKSIHSVSFRVKETNSMLVKIVKKKSVLSKIPSDDYEMEKYRDLNCDNYYKILTDLIGIRILIRYRSQWGLVHNWIWERFYKGSDKYIKNYIDDYKNESEPFIAEQPIIYYRHDDDKIYLKQLDPDESIFNYKFSKEGYNSMHYIINIDGKYTEIQVRTIFDEAWSECTHDLVYKCKNKKLQKDLDDLSKCLAKQTVAAESITNMMYEKVNKKKTEEKFKLVSLDDSIKKDYNKNVKNSIDNRIKRLNNKDNETFDGDITKII